MEYSGFGLCPVCSVTTLDNGKSKSQAVTQKLERSFMLQGNESARL